MPAANTNRHNTGGFSLVELLIAIALSGVLLAAICSVFTMQNKSYTVQEQVAEMQQNARVAMDVMSREIRMAGYGAPSSSLSSWVNWVSGVTVDANPKIIQGTSGAPDAIHVVGCFDSASGTLSSAASSGATTLVLQSSAEAGQFNTTSKKVLCINGVENAIVTAVSGSNLTIDTNPVTGGNQGLSGSYSAGASVYLVKAISFTVSSNNLLRNENTGAGAQQLAGNVSDLQISQSGNTVSITSLTTRTANSDPQYTLNSGYRTCTLSTSIQLRN